MSNINVMIVILLYYHMWKVRKKRYVTLVRTFVYEFCLKLSIMFWILQTNEAYCPKWLNMLKATLNPYTAASASNHFSNVHVQLFSEVRSRGYTTFFILNSAEHEIYPAHKCLNANNFGILTFISMINTTSERLKARNFFSFVGSLAFMSSWNFVLSWVEHEKSFITSRRDACLSCGMWKSTMWLCFTRRLRSA